MKHIEFDYQFFSIFFHYYLVNIFIKPLQDSHLFSLLSTMMVKSIFSSSLERVLGFFIHVNEHIRRNRYFTEPPYLV